MTTETKHLRHTRRATGVYSSPTTRPYEGVIIDHYNDVGNVRTIVLRDGSDTFERINLSTILTSHNDDRPRKWAYEVLKHYPDCSDPIKEGVFEDEYKSMALLAADQVADSHDWDCEWHGSGRGGYIKADDGDVNTVSGITVRVWPLQPQTPGI